MSEKTEPTNPIQNPDAFVNDLIDQLNIQNDAQLARMLMLQPPMISKIRHGIVGLTSTFVVRVHEASGLPISRIKQMAGVELQRYPTRDEVIAGSIPRSLRVSMGLTA